jgi:hypothetical protein
MIIEEKILTCSCCGKTFNTEYYHGGSTEHDNYTNDHNMNVFVNRFLEEENEKGRYKFFKNSIVLQVQSYENADYDVCISIFECRVLWLKNKGYNDIARYMESNKPNSKLEFNNIIETKIQKLQKQINTLKKRKIE